MLHILENHVEIPWLLHCLMKWDLHVHTHTSNQNNNKSELIKQSKRTNRQDQCCLLPVSTAVHGSSGPGRAAAACNLICSRQIESLNSSLNQCLSILISSTILRFFWVLPTAAVLFSGPWAPRPASPDICWLSLNISCRFPLPLVSQPLSRTLTARSCWWASFKTAKVTNVIPNILSMREEHLVGKIGGQTIWRFGFQDALALYM